MRILQLCNKSPYPPVEGGPIAMHALSRMFLKNNYKLKILAFNSNKQCVSLADVPEEYKKETAIELIDIDLKIKPLQAIYCLLTNRSLHIQRFISKKFSVRLKEILTTSDYDVVCLESLYVAPYISLIRKYSNAKIFLRAHNVEHKIWERIGEQTKPSFKKYYLRLLANQLKRYELNALQKTDAVFTISAVDQTYFAAQGLTIPIRTLAFGIDTDKLPTISCLTTEINLFSLASMNWIPNLEGLQWFLENVWMKVHAVHPQLKLRLAGRNMPETWAKKNYPQVEIVGEVADAYEFMQSNGVLIVPLFSGSGIRIKIIEAMSLGKVVITTSIGLEGIDAVDKQHVLIADTAEDFVKAIDFCLTHPQQITAIGENAAAYVRTHHNERIIAEQLKQWIEKQVFI